MVIFLVLLNVSLFIVVLALLRSINRYRESFRQTSLLKKWPISKLKVGQFDAKFLPESQGPSKSTEISFIGSYGTQGSISDFETWILCNFAKTSRAIFEFGTFTGKTTYLLAKNAPQDSKVFTLTLPPESHSSYQTSKTDHKKDIDAALQESIFTQFYYTNNPIASKIIQLFGDSKLFDETPYLSQMELIFIDGSHAHSYVENDTQKALKMIKPGGIIFWHDYRGPKRTQGVFKALNALNKKFKLTHIAGTSLVAYRA